MALWFPKFSGKITGLVILGILGLGHSSVQAGPQPIQEDPCHHLTVMVRLAKLSEGSKADLISTIQRVRSLICQPSSPLVNPTYRWPSGQTVNLGVNWYYPNGAIARVLSTWYYPNGRILNLNSAQWYYPTGQIAKAGSTWYYPNGQPFNSGQIQPQHPSQNPSEENFSQNLQRLEYLWSFRKQR